MNLDLVAIFNDSFPTGNGVYAGGSMKDWFANINRGISNVRKRSFQFMKKRLLQDSVDGLQSFNNEIDNVLATSNKMFGFNKLNSMLAKFKKSMMAKFLELKNIANYIFNNRLRLKAIRESPIDDGAKVDGCIKMIIEQDHQAFKLGGNDIRSGLLTPNNNPEYRLAMVISVTVESEVDPEVIAHKVISDRKSDIDIDSGVQGGDLFTAALIIGIISTAITTYMLYTRVIKPLLERLNKVCNVIGRGTGDIFNSGVNNGKKLLRLTGSSLRSIGRACSLPVSTVKELVNKTNKYIKSINVADKTIAVNKTTDVDGSPKLNWRSVHDMIYMYIANVVTMFFSLVTLMFSPLSDKDTTTTADEPAQLINPKDLSSSVIYGIDLHVKDSLKQLVSTIESKKEFTHFNTTLSNSINSLPSELGSDYDNKSSDEKKDICTKHYMEWLETTVNFSKPNDDSNDRYNEVESVYESNKDDASNYESLDDESVHDESLQGESFEGEQLYYDSLEDEQRYGGKISRTHHKYANITVILLPAILLGVIYGMQ